MLARAAAGGGFEAGSSTMLARAAGAGGFEAGNPAFTFRGSRSIVASVGRENLFRRSDTRAEPSPQQQSPAELFQQFLRDHPEEANRILSQMMNNTKPQ
jgi:hypothetical protein